MLKSVGEITPHQQGEDVVICPHIREGYSNHAQATTFGAGEVYSFPRRQSIFKFDRPVI